MLPMYRLSYKALKSCLPICISLFNLYFKDGVRSFSKRHPQTQGQEKLTGQRDTQSETSRTGKGTQCTISSNN